MAVYRIRVRGHSASILDWSWGLHVSAATGQAATLSADAADATVAWWNGVPSGTNAVKTLYAIDTVVDDVLVDELDGENRANVQQSVTSIVLAGTATGEPLPPQVAVVMSKVSDVPTRRGRGRSSAPPPTVDSLNSGKIASASHAIYANAWKNFMSSLATAAGGAYTPIILNRPGKFGDPPTPFTPFSTVKVGDVFDTQRPRRAKLKEVFTVLNFP